MWDTAVAAAAVHLATSYCIEPIHNLQEFTVNKQYFIYLYATYKLKRRVIMFPKVQYLLQIESADWNARFTADSQIFFHSSMRQQNAEFLLIWIELPDILLNFKTIHCLWTENKNLLLAKSNAKYTTY